MLEIPLLANSRIEISGWDASDNFFVERTRLEGEKGDRPFVFLQHAIEHGALLFVRAMDSVLSAHQLPVAYRAEGIEPVDGNGLSKVGLVRLRRNPQSSEELS